MSREAAIELNASLQEKAGAPEYLTAYQKVQKAIDVKRSERKARLKTLAAYTTGDGERAEAAAKIRQRRRERKLTKKKEKQTERIFFSKLNR